MNNILYISYDGLTDPLGSSQVMPYIEGLVAYNYHFTIVSLEKHEAFKAIEPHIKKRLQGKPVKWVPLTYKEGRGMKSKLHNNRSLKNTVCEILEKAKFDLIHARSYPASLIALKASQKKGIPFIFDMRGFWADERVDGKIWNLKKPFHKLLYNYFKQKEKLLLKKSRHVISLTQAAKNYMVNHFAKRVNENKITVIPCCADLDHFNLPKGNEREKSRAKLQIKNSQRVIIYSGSVGTWYLLDEMVAFFKCFMEKFPDAVFLILTQKDHALVHDTFIRQGIHAANYRVAGAIREKVPEFIHAADASLYFIKPAFSKMASSPVKLAEFMGCGLPVIANAGIGDVDEHAAENNQLILVHELNRTGYLAAIDTILALPKSKEAARNFALTHYSLEMGVERYKKVYENILGK